MLCRTSIIGYIPALIVILLLLLLLPSLLAHASDIGVPVPPECLGCTLTTLPASQLRALLVFAVLVFTLLHQLHLGRELAALRGDSTAAGGPRGSGGEEVAGVNAGDGSRSAGGLAGGMVASALGPLMSAAGSAHCVLQALVDRVAGRGPLGGALPGLLPPH